MKCGIGIVGICLLLASCETPEPRPLRHDYPAPPSVKRMTEAGACQGGGGLAAKSLPLPKFPRRAKRQERQGWVVVSLDVNTDGSTSNVFVKRAAPPDIFERTTIRAVQNWRFQPPGKTGLDGCLVFISYRLGRVRIGQ
ncbi:hypothetical protein MNBD_ALPHA06-2066 [hydrothermal vent metagenome]|uniref:Protein TonB n=1 Tax=hydrothermal vent metagenome TaxID=652676 RepID=A0A3B0RR66_9ZZZZ